MHHNPEASLQYDLSALETGRLGSVENTLGQIHTRSMGTENSIFLRAFSMSAAADYARWLLSGNYTTWILHVH